MKSIRINSLKIGNFRSFGKEENFTFANTGHPIAIVGYNNAGKTNVMSSIKYALYESIREDTFQLKDFHNCKWDNPPSFELEFISKGLGNGIRDNITYTNSVQIIVEEEAISSVIDDSNVLNNGGYRTSKKWILKQNAPIYYINFHNIKDEISTQKSSWGTLKSFLGRHIKKMVENDVVMKTRKVTFRSALEKATKEVLDGVDKEDPENKTELRKFIDLIRENYSKNLRNNDCVVEFGLPNYEDIFLQMMFKVGLNGDITNLIPIDHFGDGFISMFVMSVIQAIAETNIDDRCLFLFEEPESFLHDNHQEYFYNMVLKSLTEKGHQVIYTTHSDKMVNIFKTQSYIRIELEQNKLLDWETKIKYNDVEIFSPRLPDIEGMEVDEVRKLQIFTSYIKTIEPNLNRLIFSRKVLLVEGPNDLLVYSRTIQKKVNSLIQVRDDIVDKEKFARTYLSFLNISIVPHHGKATVILLINLCRHIKIDYYVINDWDFETKFLSELSEDVDVDIEANETVWASINEERGKNGTPRSISTIRAMITTLRNIIVSIEDINKIHFNHPKLERVIGYNSDDKDSIKIYNQLISLDPVPESLFPESLEQFLEFYNLK